MIEEQLRVDSRSSDPECGLKMTQQLTQFANSNPPKFNNIDWLRLIFALQVLLIHVYRNLADTHLDYIVH